MQSPSSLLALSAVFAIGLAGVVHAQSASQPGSYLRLSGGSNPALRFFTGAAARDAHLPPVQQQQSQIQRVQAAAAGKPFEHAVPSATISPYLSLDLREAELGIPNYYAFVKPQLQQRQANQAQAAELQRLQQQLRTATAAGGVSRNTSGGIPNTGTSVQFMNTGGYYSTPVLR